MLGDVDDEGPGLVLTSAALSRLALTSAKEKEVIAIHKCVYFLIIIYLYITLLSL